MMKNDCTTGSLLARRALAEKATPGPWVRKGEYLVYGPWGDRPVSGKEGILNQADAARIAANDTRPRKEGHEWAGRCCSSISTG